MCRQMMEGNSIQQEQAKAEIRIEQYEGLICFLRSLGSRTPQELASGIAGKLHSVIDFDLLEVLVYRLGGGGEVEWQVVAPEQASTSVNVSSEDSPIWWVYQNQKALLMEDCDHESRFSSFAEELKSSGMAVQCICWLPLTTPQHPLGVLGIAHKRPRTYAEEDLQFLALVADSIALVIDNVLNFEASRRAQAELESRNSRLQFLLSLANRVTSNLDLRDILRTISASIRDLVMCDGAAVLLEDQKNEKLRVYALDFPGNKGIIREELLLSPEGPGAAAIQSLKPMIQNYVVEEEVSSEVYELVSGEGIKSTCMIPLVNRGRGFGLLALARKDSSPFVESDTTFLFQVAGQIAIAVENAMAFSEIRDLKDKLAQEKLYLEEEIRSEFNFDQIVGKSSALRHVLELVNTVAPSDSTVLLLGETGTGKELIARAIHEHSRRRDRTFVKLNCAAIPTGLLESELFGHEKGAFTGAIMQKIGRLELADQGTLFLDEVGDIPPEIQPKLLRALQEREFERLGSIHTRKVNVRLVAATNRDLEQMIANREFRSDLYYRLNVFPIRIPPLRERKEDIPLLVRFFVQKFARQMQKNIESIPSVTLKALTGLSWPGNIRELENLIERAVILTRGRSLEAPLSELSRSVRKDPVAVDNSDERIEITRIVREMLNQIKEEQPPAEVSEYDERQREEITRVLSETKGRVGGPDGAAARMGLRRTTLIYRMKRLGIDARSFS